MRSFFVRLVAAFALLAITSSPALARARWQRAETPHFVFYSEVSDRNLREAARKLELFDAELRTLWHLPEVASANKLDVYLLLSSSRLREVWPSVGSDVLGFYTSEPELIAAFATYTDTGLTRQEVLFHEYVHHFMFQNLTAAYPAWFVEGFAEYLATMKFDDAHATIGYYSEGRAYDLISDNWPTTDQFLRHPSNMTPALESSFYAESWTAVHYLYDDNAHMAHFISYVEALESGADPVQAFGPAFGVTPLAFEQMLHRYARARIGLRIGPLPQFDPSIAITAMPESANDLLLPLARLKGGVKEADAPALAARIEQIAARYPDDPFAQRVRARGMLARGGFADARALVTPMLSAAPDDPELNYLMGRTYLDEAAANHSANGATSAARRYFVKAFRVAPNDVPTMFDYVETYAFGDRMPDSVVDVAVHVSNLAPQVMSTVLPTSYLLMQRQRWDEAIVLLRRMAYSPHGGEGAEEAQQYLQAAIQHHMPVDLDPLQPLAPAMH